jgi:hypothetical protein
VTIAVDVKNQGEEKFDPMQIADTMRNKYFAWKSKYPERWLRRLPADMEWGKRIFNNPTPFTEQLRGRYFLWKARLGGGRSSPSSEGLKSRQLGFRPLGRIATDTQIAEVQAQLEKVLAVPRPDDFRFKGELATRSILFAKDEVPGIMQLLTPEVLAAVREYYGCNFQLLNVSAWRNWHIKPDSVADEAYSNNWHTDCRRIDMLKVFIVATDVSDQDGPTHVLSREWTREVVRKGYKHRRDYQIPIDFIENPQHMVQLTGPAGTALLCNTNLCFHRAGIPGPGRYRDLIEFRFLASPSYSLNIPENSSVAWRDRMLQ